MNITLSGRHAVHALAFMPNVRTNDPGSTVAGMTYPKQMSSRRIRITVAGCLAIVLSLVAVACGGADDAKAGIRLVSPTDGASIQADPPEDLVVLDVRTPEEFAERHLDGAIMIDFYEEDFATQLAQLDPTAAYLLYCRSGNRSGQTAKLMEQLGFTDVADVDGGINAWTAAGLPTVP